VTAPAGMVTPLACNAVPIAVGETPAVASRAGLGMITTCWSRAPVTSTVRTPSMDSSSGTTVSVSWSASARSSPLPAAASTTAGRSSVLPASTCGSTPSGNWIRFSAVCILLTASSRSVPNSYSTPRVALPSWDVEVTLVSPAMPWMLFSIGSATCSSMTSGPAPGYGAMMKAAGNSSEGRSCCFSDGTAYTPNAVITIAMSATSPRLARLSLARNDISGLLLVAS
jgi:hypothetical protein